MKEHGSRLRDRDHELRTLIERTGRGELDAFETLVVALLPTATAYVRGIVRDDDLADDVVQAALIEILRSAGRFDPARRSLPWIFTILRRRIVDEHRRSRPSEDLTILELTPSALPGPEALAESRERAGRIRAALLALDAPTRDSGLLRLAGYTRDEIGAIVGSGPATTKDRIARALRVARAAALT
jgi:RNA polymerase sigma-70 factor (ECF subfamily)